MKGEVAGWVGIAEVREVDKVGNLVWVGCRVVDFGSRAMEPLTRHRFDEHWRKMGELVGCFLAGEMDRVDDDVGEGLVVVSSADRLTLALSHGRRVIGWLMMG